MTLRWSPRPRRQKPWCVAILGRQHLMAPAMFAGNVNKAIESLQKSLALNPQQDETWIWLGLAFKKKGDTTKAREALDKALQLNPQSPFAHNASRSLSQYSLRFPLPENCPRSAGEIAVLTLAVTRPFCLGSRPRTRRLEHLKRSSEHRSNGEKSRRGQREACAKAVLPRADNCRSMILVKSASDCAPLKNSPLIKKVGVALTPAWEPASKSC